MPKFIPALEDVVRAWRSGVVCASGEMSTNGEEIYSYETPICITSFYCTFVLDKYPSKQTQKHLAAIRRVFETEGNEYPWMLVSDLAAEVEKNAAAYWSEIEDTLNRRSVYLIQGA